MLIKLFYKIYFDLISDLSLKRVSKSCDFFIYKNWMCGKMDYVYSFPWNSHFGKNCFSFAKKKKLDINYHIFQIFWAWELNQNFGGGLFFTWEWIINTTIMALTTIHNPVYKQLLCAVGFSTNVLTSFDEDSLRKFSLKLS